ncbi:O-antigen ligase family protein [Parapedobacter koreensis]|nr:O-antigen ligase family protein [Parapedobacter koreensis]
MAMRLIDMVVLGLPILFFLLNRTAEYLTIKVANICFIFFFLFLFGLYSLVNGYLMGITKFNFRDPLDVIRYLQIPVFMLFGYYLALRSEFSVKNILSVFIIIILIIGVFAVMQKIMPIQFGFVTKLYAPEHQSEKLTSTERVTTIFGNPNTTALMACLLSSFILGCTLVKGFIKSFTVLTMLGICGLVVLLSGSRTGFIACGFLTIVYLFLRMRNKFMFILISVTFIFGVWLFRGLILDVIKYFNYYLYVGIQIVLNLDFETLFAAGNTFSRRFDRWFIAIDLFRTSPIFGLGPLRGVVVSSTDNYYIYILLRNGIIGLSLYLFFVIYSLSIAIHGLKLTKEIKLFSYVYIFQTCIILLMNFLIEAQIQNSVVYLHLTTLGILLGLMKQRINEKNI